VKLNTDVISAGPLTVPSLSICISRSQKLDHVTYLNTFSFYSCAFQFMSNVAVKWETFHVYILYFILAICLR
jgi:hypothetical protein